MSVSHIKEIQENPSLSPAFGGSWLPLGRKSLWVQLGRCREGRGEILGFSRSASETDCSGKQRIKLLGSTSLIPSSASGELRRVEVSGE